MLLAYGGRNTEALGASGIRDPVSPRIREVMQTPRNGTSRAWGLQLKGVSGIVEQAMNGGG